MIRPNTNIKEIYGGLGGSVWSGLLQDCCVYNCLFFWAWYLIFFRRIDIRSGLLKNVIKKKYHIGFMIFFGSILYTISIYV